jgi:hypothetical protein
MNPYSVYKKGSTWSKWDLHLHTPNTKLSDCYKTDDGSDTWDRFISTIEKSDVQVFGITDYFSIENYKYFLEKYKAKYPDTDKVFFPNIEFRLDVSVNKNAEEVNIHVIFDNQLPIDEIKDFLSRLPSNIKQNDAIINCNNLNNVQINTAAITCEQLQDCLKNKFGSRICYIIGAAANHGGLRPIKSPRKMNISDNIERYCNFLFGNNQNKEYYLRTNRYENGEKYIPKPVICGSDSHSFQDLEEKLGRTNGFSWIKANTI